MPRSVTSANSSFTLIIPDVFPIPIQVAEYATDDAFSWDNVDAAETMMGVDGKMSAGYTPFITPQTVHLQANSRTIPLFDQWLASMKAAQELFFASGSLVLPSIGITYVLNGGVLKQLKRIDGKKVLQPTAYMLHWESVDTVPLT